MHRFFSCVAAVGLVALVGAAVASSGSRNAASTQSAARATAFPRLSWPVVGGDLANSRYSSLTQINRANVAKLKRVWTTDINPGFNSSSIESPPTVVGSTLYASSSRGTPSALDAATGKLLWNSDPTTRGGKIGNGRGVSIGDGMLFAGQGDGTLTAFDLATGAVRWKTLINTGNVPTYSPATPIYWNHMVFTSLSGNDLGKLRGGIFAYDARTGALKWTFYIVPFAGQPGSKTWGDPKELEVGGGGTWTYGAIDAKRGLLYEPTGNPSPDFGRTAGKNLYTDAVIALNLKTGKLKWYYQTTHHDQWDYDCASPPILYDLKVGKNVQHGVTISCKNGYTYNLDRVTGKPLTPVKELPPPNAKNLDSATRTAVATWSKTQPVPTHSNLVPHCATAAMVPGPAPDGKPYEYSCTFAYVGPDHFTVHPVAIGGAVNYEPGSLNPALGYTYVCSIFNIESSKAVPGAPSPLGAIAPGLAGQVFGATGGYNGTPLTGHLLGGTFTAVDLRNDKNVWQKRYYSDSGISCKSGSSATASGLVFVTDTSGVLHAYNARTGRDLWSYSAPEGMVVNSAPAIYSVKGKEYIALAASLGTKTGSSQAGKNAVIAFALP
jgi:PQQ-dependent dehydrogenase (methanol/ethanol family)